MPRRATHGDKKGYCCGVALLKESEESRRGEGETGGASSAQAATVLTCCKCIRHHIRGRGGGGMAKQDSDRERMMLQNVPSKSCTK